MSLQRKHLVALTAVMIISAVAILGAQSQIEQQQAAGVVADASSESLPVEHPVAASIPQEGDAVLSDGILLMREEEKLARDVYLALYETWGIRTFASIANSEQRHMDAVAELLDLQGIDDPVKDALPGEFQNETMASLYAQLVEQGSQSPAAALAVGALIEDLDIHDLETLLAQTDDPDAIRVYTNLLRGSENHMRSFTRQLDRYGKTYEAQYISADRLAEILAGR